MNDTPRIRIEDFVYLTVDGVPLEATLYRPEGTGFPGIIDVHGGRWIENDRTNNADIAKYLAHAGIAVLSIDFRMPPVAGYPGSVHDIHYAVRWFKANAARFGVRADAIGGLGTSSGGHQLLLTTLKPGPEPYGMHPMPAEIGTDIDASLAYIVAGWPVSDPLARYDYATKNGLDGLLEAHALYWTPLSDMEDGNPQRMLENKSCERLPPLLLLQGSADENFDYRMNERFVETYQSAGGEATFALYDGAPHAFIIREPESTAARQALERMGRFIHACA